MVSDAPLVVMFDRVVMRRSVVVIRRIAAVVLALACQPAGVPAVLAAERPAARPAASAPAADEEYRLNALFEDDAHRQEALDPLGAISRGQAVDAAELSRVFTDSLDRERLELARKSLTVLAGIDRTRLGPQAAVSYDAFSSLKRDQVRWFQPDMRALMAVQPFNHVGGLHVELPAMMSGHGTVAFQTEHDYRRALALDSAFPRIIDNAILRFRQGMAHGITQPRQTVSIMVDQIDAVLAQEGDASPFLAPVQLFPAAIPQGRRARLRADFTRTVCEAVLPAYRRLRAFLADEYLPASRQSPGLGAMPGGAGLYRELIRRETTLPIDPEVLHLTGMAEVARIRREMDVVRADMGFSGTLEAFFAHVRDDPRYHPRDARQLAAGYQDIDDAVARQLPRFFRRLPRNRLKIEPYPEYLQRFEPGGGYQPGEPDGSVPGTFYYNTYDLPGRFLTGMTTLYLHEAMPGHHLQISLAMENEALPAFQRFGGNSAFVEGWALYAESLGYAMGLYRDPAQHWGTLDDEMLRAMRLVVDTGIHAKGWSRDQAIAYMLANSGMSAADATGEVDRYIADPAQAVSYKIGALTIQRLRRKAEAALGRRFDLRAFHAQVLETGALPLAVLEAKIDAWIAAGQ